MLSDPALAPILAASELAYVVVESKSGPMVTPLLFSVSDGRLWMVMPTASAKISAIGRNPVVGVTIRSGDTTAIVQGDARLVDPLKPQSLLASIPEALRSPRAMGGYVGSNLKHLAGMVGPAALAPRTLAAVRPQRVAVDGGATGGLWTKGAWTPAPVASETPSSAHPQPALRLLDVPDALGRMTEQTLPVIVGWSTATGPIGLPGSWDPAGNVARVSPELFARLGAQPVGPGCILFDATVGRRLDGKTGMVVRGGGSARVVGDALEISVEPSRISWWQGATAKTVKVA